jgi:hypothetical protein
MSNRNKNTIKAFNKGYRVTELGCVLYKGKTRRLDEDSRGYLRFSIGLGNGKYAGIWVHKLAAYQLYGDKAFKSCITVRHLDGDPKNNALKNIDIGTLSVNMNDIPLEIRKKTALNAASYRRKFNENQVKDIRRANKLGISYKDLAKRYGVCKATIHYIIHKKTYAWA